MLVVLGLDDLGQLELIVNPLKCLNLNPIMPEVIGPDDLGQLALIANSLKCLDLNPIMPKVLGPDGLGQLTLIQNSRERLNLKFNHAWNPQIKLFEWVSITMSSLQIFI